MKSLSNPGFLSKEGKPGFFLFKNGASSPLVEYRSPFVEIPRRIKIWFSGARFTIIRIKEENKKIHCLVNSTLNRAFHSLGRMIFPPDSFNPVLTEQYFFAPVKTRTLPVT